MSVISSDWVIIAYYLSKGDKDGLRVIPADVFTGIPRLVYDIIMDLPEPSIPVLIEEYTSRSGDAETAQFIQQSLTSVINVNESIVQEHIKALLYSHGGRRIASILQTGLFEIGEGQNRFRVSEKIQAALSSVSEYKTEKTIDQVFEQLAQEEHEFIPVTIPKFQSIGVTKWMYGNIMSLAGDTGTFKTTFANHIALEALKADPDLHYVCFMKEQPSREVWQKIITMLLETIPYDEVISKLGKGNEEFVAKAKDVLLNSPIGKRIHVVDQGDFSTPYDVISILRGYASRHKKIIWVLDYLTCLDFEGSMDNYNLNLATGLRALKNATMTTGSFGIIINQLKAGWNIDSMTKMYIKKFPVREDIIWSSEIRNLSAYILMIYCPGQYFPEMGRKLLFTTFNKVRFTEVNERTIIGVDGAYQKFFTPDDISEMNAITFMTQRNRR